MNPEYPSNFKQIITDFTADLTTVFPEYSMLWQKWTAASLGELSEEDLYLEMSYLYEYCTTVFPERFFDILYQNAEIFDTNSPKDTPVNTCFLPGVEFKLLYNVAGVSENTQKTMWKYLQLILFTIVGTLQDKSKFGASEGLFDGVNETELHSKLNETIGSISEFFQNMNQSGEESDKVLDSETNSSSDNPSLNSDDIHSHLKGLFDGKIGNLAKEMAEDISKDLSGILEGAENMTSTQDVLKALMKDPTKITGLIKTVGEKLNSKINSGEISQEELMREAGDLLSKMKGMSGAGGANPFQGLGGLGGDNPLAGMGDMMDMMKTMMGSGGGKDMMKMAMQMMGKGGKSKKSSDDPFADDEEDGPNPLAGLGDMFKNMGNGGRLDTNAMDRMSKMNATKDRMRQKMMMRKAEAALKEQAVLKEQAALKEQQHLQITDTTYSLVQGDQPNNYVFSLDENDVQLTSTKPTGEYAVKSKKNKKKKGKK